VRELATLSDEDTHELTTRVGPPAKEALVTDAPATVVDAPAARALSTRPPIPEPRDDAQRDAERDAERYRVGDLLGEGGMGEVRLCTDTRIGRDIAMKVIRPEIAQNKKLRGRFLFEAKVQGLLEHPAIVPVYDLGTRPDGSAYFTMKRVRGRTLHEVLKDLRLGDRAAARVYSRRRLLLAFQSVCLAVEHAHQRGIVHRDLKPANVMLGDLGEVSILDWGLAKQTSPDPSGYGARPASVRPRYEETAIGEVLGTPGYMSPEQAADSQSVDARSDIFALGSMLFELLTLRQLVPGATAAEVTKSTIIGRYERHIGKRFPELDVPPELEAACARACEHDPQARFETAKQLADAIERFLDGDRDDKRRRHMADKHTRAAIAALAESTEAASDGAAREARGRAIREVSRALAIDPQNPTALRTMMRIATELPSAIAPEAEAAVTAKEALGMRKAARRGMFAYLLVSANLLLMAWLGVQSAAWLLAAAGLFAGAAAVAFVASRRTTPEKRFGVPLVALSSCGIVAVTAMFGALLFAPSLCAANVVVFAAGGDRNVRTLALGGGVAAIVLPLVAQLAGWMPGAWLFHDGQIVIAPAVVRFPEVPTLLVLALASIGTIVLPAVLVGAERDARAKAERELALRAHQLAELVPIEAKEPVSTQVPDARRAG
jgi:serine/threonine-protein kinase